MHEAIASLWGWIFGWFGAAPGVAVLPLLVIVTEIVIILLPLVVAVAMLTLA